ncbi:Fibrocystin-L, partial [Bulinus truncatus]
MPVRVGNSKSTVVSYTDDKIVAYLPSLPDGSYRLVIDVLNKGFADLWLNNIPDIVYTLNVQSMSPDFGSLYGGTDLVITGDGFSLNSSEMSVTVGPHNCSIMKLSETFIQCRIEDTGKRHNVSATGHSKILGYGYAWDKDPIVIQVNDYITWTWQAPDYVSDIGYSIQQTATPYDKESLSDGFSSGVKTRKGSYTHHFTVVGVYYYWTGFMDSAKSVYIRGKIQVTELHSYSVQLSVKVMGIESKYLYLTKVSSLKKRNVAEDKSTGCPDSKSASLCDKDTPLHIPTNKFSFWFLKCVSPSIESVSKEQGTFSDVISLTGQRFGTLTCQHEILYDTSVCLIHSLHSNKIDFSVTTLNSPPIGEFHDFKMRVKNYGYALFTNSAQKRNEFKLLPKVTSIHPTEGSKAGGTKITITGVGFSDNPKFVFVHFDCLSCVTESASYTQIICETKCEMKCNAGIEKVNVLIQGKNDLVTAQCTGEQCSLFTTEALTPTVTHIIPESVSSDSTQLEICGTHFGTTLKKLKVNIGGQSCQITEPVTEHKIICTIKRLPVGPNEIKVYVDNKGLAFTTHKVTSKAVAVISVPESASVYGGAMMVIDGNGFTQDTSIKVDTLECPVVTISLSKITCILPAHAEGTVVVSVVSNSIHYDPLSLRYSLMSTPKVISINPNGGTENTEIVITGTSLISAANKSTEIKIGGVACTNIKDVTATSITCTTGAQNTGKFPVEVFVEQMGLSNSDVIFTYQLGSLTINPQKGSANGGQLVTLTGSGFLEGKTSVTICGAVCGEVSMDTSDYVCRTSAVNGCNNELNNSCEDVINDTSKESTCDVIASVEGVSRIIQASYVYDYTLKSIVTSVSPSRGGTAGGTTLTITGTNFGILKESISVMIAGVPCNVQSVADTQIQCITGPSSSVVARVEVQIDKQGIAKQINAEFEYIDVWSSHYTWGGEPPPGEGEFVIIPANQTILLDTNTSVLKMLLIQGGHLIFDEANVELKAENILIMDGGVLQIGSSNRPFPDKYKAIITLYGHLRSREVPIYGAKTLAVRNGTLNLYGSPVKVPWTLLAKTAKSGSTELELEHDVDWKEGDHIVIATTGARHSQRETETSIIKSISGKKVILTDSLKYEHLGIVADFDDQKVHFKAEVGLLTRNIIVRGNKAAGFNSTVPACPEGFDTGEFAVQTCFQGRFGEELGSSQFGSQIMVHQLGKDTQIAQAHIQYVEMTFAGQAFRLGRYPVHLHLNGNMSHSFVEYNIVYNIMGGACFLEDGNEVGNIFQYNLALLVRSSTSLRNDDITPAAFWATNPNNTIRHNHVAGGTHFGYWYRLHKHPDGPGFDINICPQAAPLGEFRNNTAHSQGWFGLWIFEIYIPKKDGSCQEKAPHKEAKFYSLTAWNCQKGAESVNFGAVQFYHFVLVNNEMAGFEGKILSLSPPYYDHESKPGIFNSVIVDHYDNILQGQGTLSGVIIPHYMSFLIQEVTFVNFNMPNRAALGWALIKGVCEIKCVGFTVKLKALKFIDSPNKVKFDWEFQGILFDEDGTLTGGRNFSAVSCSPSYDRNNCVKEKSFSVGVDGFKKQIRMKRSTDLMITDVLLRIKHCYFRNCQAPSSFNVYTIPNTSNVWSNPLTWVNVTEDGLEPKPFSDLLIPKGKWIKVDKSIPKLGKVVIEGVLQFVESEELDVILDSECIYILGRLIAGWNQTYPFRGKLVLRLRSSAPIESPFIKGGPSLGSKFIAVYGGLKLHGKDRGIIKTFLASSVDSGNVITVTDDVQWATGDVILITTTDYNPWHTETFTITSVIGRDISLNDTVKYRHIAHIETIRTKRFVLSAVVALLSRNIKIEAEEDNHLFRQSQGARVIVAQASYKEEQLIGFAQISNVEFFHSGQEGFKDSYDPRFSIAFVDIFNSVESERYSYVKKSSFYCGFNTAVGVFSVNNLEINENIVHHTVGAGMTGSWYSGGWDRRGIRTEAAMTEITNNLITLIVWPGTYQDRQEELNTNFEGAIEALLADDLILINNTVTGSERVGYRLKGQKCNTIDSLLWKGNVAVGTLLGIATTPDDVMVDPGCVAYSGFLLWKNFDFGIYYNHYPSLVIKNNILIENGVGIFPMIIGPSSAEHKYENKFVDINNNVLIGKTSSFSENLDHLDGGNEQVKFSSLNRGHGSSKPCGKIGIQIVTFTSGTNAAPKKEFTLLKIHPSIKGSMYLTSNIFVSYNSCSGGRDFILGPNKDNDDACHPVLVKNSTLINIEHSSKFFFYPPFVVKVNPSDCVDMDCDGLKKCLIEDLDGTFLGHMGYVLPNSAYEWDGNPRHGLGDYRIPKIMLAKSDGTFDNVTSKAPNKGIYKTDKCTWVSKWNAFECTDIYKWRLLSFESMDADHRTRRLSPVAIYHTDGYVDLINGPQAHGWCNGYSCRDRLSLFQAIISLDTTFYIYLSSEPPKVMRYMLHISSLKDCVGLAIPHLNLNRMEVRVNGSLVMTNNGYIDSKGHYRLHLAETDVRFMPDAKRKVNGENFLSDNDTFYFVVCGDSEVTVEETPVLILSLTFDSVTEDDFYSEKIVENLAAFLNVPSSKVRIVKIVRNKLANRERREIEKTSENITYDVEIADSPREKETSLDFDYLASRISIQAEFGNLSEELQLPVIGVSLVQPGDDNSKKNELKFAKQLVLTTQPVGDVSVGQILKVQPVLTLLDVNGNIMENMGFTSLKWVVEASIQNQDTSDSILLNNAAVFEDGWANFSGLAVLQKGVYTLKFQITTPPEAMHYVVLSQPIRIHSFDMQVDVQVLTPVPITDEPVVFNVGLIDVKTRERQTNLNWIIWSWAVNVNIYSSFIYTGRLSGTVNLPLDRRTGDATFNIILNKAGICPLLISIESNPPNYTTQIIHLINLMTPYQVNLEVTETQIIELNYNLIFNERYAAYWSAYIRNHYSNYFYLRIIKDEFKEGSLIVILTVEMGNKGFLNIMEIICQEATNSSMFNFNGTFATLSPIVKVNGSVYNKEPCYTYAYTYMRRDVQRQITHVSQNTTLSWISILGILCIGFLFLPLLKMKLSTHS